MIIAFAQWAVLGGKFGQDEIARCIFVCDDHQSHLPATEYRPLSECDNHLG
jgi:hypothetical protein